VSRLTLLAELVVVLVLEEVGQVEELGHQLTHVLRVGARQRTSRLLHHHRDIVTSVERK
jgi:hypothetical protein